MKNRGFSLIELIVVMAIAVILFAIGIPMYASWSKKTQVKKDIYNIYSLLNDARVKAFTMKNNCTVSFISSNEFRLTCGNNLLSVINTKTPIGHSFQLGSDNMTFGIDGSANIVGTIFSLELKNKPATCITVSRLRIAIGEWDGKDCKVEE